MPPSQQQDFLADHFLIAMPQLEDTYFANSLIYLWRHSEEGALGLVINKPLEISLREVLEQLQLQDQRPPGSPQIVLSGGPVETDKGFILHDAAPRWTASMAVTEDLSLTTSKDILEDIGREQGPANYLLALGCAGWSPGQLEQEIVDNTWLTCPADRDILFSREHQRMAQRAVATLGFDLAQLSPNASHC